MGAEQRPEFSTEYRYNGKNQLTDVISTNETGIEYSYDSFGRLNRRKDLLPKGKYLLREFDYDQGRLSTIRYSNQNVFLGTESRTYAYGVLKDISFGEKPVWTLVDENNLGQCTESLSGNIVKKTTYTSSGTLQGKTMKSPLSTHQNLLLGIDASTGNLSWRKDSQRNLTENFEYDELNRLTSYGNNSVSYDNRGNILTKDDAGLTLCYEDGNHPYAVTSLSGDFNRNLANYSDQRIAFNSFECPDTLEDGGVITTFVYNASGERVMMANRRSDLPTRYYVENIYEEENLGSTNNYRLYLGGDAYSAPAVYLSDGSNGKIYYLGRDHLGSITHITNEKGALLYEYSYDVWGRLRDPLTQELYSVGHEPSLFLGRGYCGHEHLPWCGLINMNARLYDPAIGRFLSPDPYIQDPENSQNFNRYSYCLNNPLKYSDPSGELFGADDILAAIIIGAAIGGTINLGIKAYNGQIHSWGNAFSAFGVGALAGGLGAVAGGWAFAATGGAIGGAGGFLAGASSGAAGAAVTTPVLSYGNHITFGDPLMSSTEYLTAIAFGGITGGVANGVLAKMNGRNFWNGNLTESPSWGYYPNETVPSQIDNAGNSVTKAETSQINPDDVVERTLQSHDFPQGSGTNSVYVGTDNEGLVRYVGITERQPELRFAEHLKSQAPRATLDYGSINGINNLSRIQARIIEQNLINAYGFGKHGYLFNKINSISPRYWDKWGIIINF